jgi:hypothetical protein
MAVTNLPFASTGSMPTWTLCRNRFPHHGPHHGFAIVPRKTAPSHRRGPRSVSYHRTQTKDCSTNRVRPKVLSGNARTAHSDGHRMPQII